MDMMKAVRFYEYGGPEVLQYETVTRPVPDPEEVLVKINAAGVNPLDAKLRSGLLREVIPLGLPLIAGSDFAGIVEQTGAAVKDFAPGDEVYGRGEVWRDGSYAQLIRVLPSCITLKPKTIDFLHAAAMPTAALTAWQALFGLDEETPFINLCPGQTILIHGGAGGVGSFAVQLAKWKGAKVIVTVRADHQGYARELGADMVIDYNKARIENEVQDIDAVLDLIGGNTQARSWTVLRHEGVLASTVMQPDEEKARKRNARSFAVSVKTSAPQLAHLAKLVDDNVLRVVVSETFLLTEARQAHAQIETGHTRGKLSLQIA